MGQGQHLATLGWVSLREKVFSLLCSEARLLNLLSHLFKAVALSFQALLEFLEIFKEL